MFGKDEKDVFYTVSTFFVWQLRKMSTEVELCVCVRVSVPANLFLFPFFLSFTMFVWLVVRTLSLAILCRLWL